MGDGDFMAQDLHSAPSRDLQGEEGNHKFMFLIFLRQFTLPARLLQRLRDPGKMPDPVWSVVLLVQHIHQRRT